MRCVSKIVVAVALYSVVLSHPAKAYIDLAPTLATVIRDAQTIAVVEVERFSLEKGAVLLKKVRELKGELSAEPMKHLVRTNDGTIDQAILEWAEPQRQGVAFVNGKSMLICLGRGWYQVQATADGWWQIGAARPELSLAFYGHVSRLAAAVPVILQDKTAVITTLPHNNDEQSDFDLPLNRQALPGLVKMNRMRASTRMPGMVMAVSGNPAFVIGPGAAGEDEIPELIKKLESADPVTRAESADDLGTLGKKGKSATAVLEKMLGDTAATPRFAAAAALLRIRGQHPQAVTALGQGLESKDAATRLAAVRAAGLAGNGAATLGKQLGKMLAENDQHLRSAALQTIATLGPAAGEAVEPVQALLTQAEFTIAAADALGRMQDRARPAAAKLAELLKAESTSVRWAGVRALAQIGGEEAKPAVDFMVNELKNPKVLDAYNMMIYLALIGPAAKDAVPAIQAMRTPVNPVLKPAAIWAINPDANLPWQIPGGFGFLGNPPPGGGPGGPGGDFVGWIFESFVRELGDRLKPTALKLAAKILDGTAGDVPNYGYKIMSKYADEVLPVFVKALGDKELAQRERAAVALGFMGAAARSAQPQVAAALAGAAHERERKLLKWCLREISAE